MKPFHGCLFPLSSKRFSLPITKKVHLSWKPLTSTSLEWKIRSTTKLKSLYWIWTLIEFHVFLLSALNHVFVPVSFKCWLSKRVCRVETTTMGFFKRTPQSAGVCDETVAPTPPESYKSGNFAPKRNRPLLLLLLKAKMLGSSSALKSSFVLALLLVSFLIVSPMAVQARSGGGGGGGGGVRTGSRVVAGGNRNSTESSAAAGQNFALEAVAPLAFLYLLSLW